MNRDEWLTIKRINRTGGKVSSVTTTPFSFNSHAKKVIIPVEQIKDYEAPTEEQAKEAAKPAPIVNYPGEGIHNMTSEEWAAKNSDYKGIRSKNENDEHKEYRFRRVMVFTNGCSSLANVYLTDKKIVDIPKK